MFTALWLAVGCGDPDAGAPREQVAGSASGGAFGTSAGGTSANTLGSGASGSLLGQAGGAPTMGTGGTSQASGGSSLGSNGSGGNSASSAGNTTGSGGGNAQGGSAPETGGGSSVGGANTDGFNPCPQIGPCKIMPMGDSITLGIGEASTHGGSYRVSLFHRILAAGKSATFVGSQSSGPEIVDGVPFPKANEGYPGALIASVEGNDDVSIDSIVTASIAATPPNIVLLMIGINSVASTSPVPSAPGELEGVLDKITAAAPNALVVLAQITPHRDEAVNQGGVAAYNAAMPGLVQTRVNAGKHIILVDMLGAFTSNPSYPDQWLADLAHPTDAGYEVMAGVWYLAIAGYLH